MNASLPQKEAYDNFLGNQIAAHLKTKPDLSVRSVALDDPEQGLSEAILAECDVLIWWGHVRNKEVSPETGKKIVDRIVKGSIALIALHSAHWSTPFVEAMNERSRRAYQRSNPGIPLDREVPPPSRYTVPKYESRLTPYADFHKFPDGHANATLHLPFCCFPAYRGDGKPSTIRVLRPDHPIALGLAPQFEIPKTEMYAEPFHVPEPDEVVLEECWATGEWFRSGMVWRLGAGRVFYFRPGHETFPVYKQAFPLMVVTNAVRWLGMKGS